MRPTENIKRKPLVNIIVFIPTSPCNVSRLFKYWCMMFNAPNQVLDLYMSQKYRLSMSLKHVRTYLSPRVCCAIKISKYPTPMHRKCINMAKLIEVILLLAWVFALQPYRSPSGRQGRQDSVSLLTPSIFLVSLLNVTSTCIVLRRFWLWKFCLIKYTPNEAFNEPTNYGIRRLISQIKTIN